MSYAQAMKWQKAHPTGGKAQDLGMSTGSGFWPSGSWLRSTFWPYLEKCEAAGIQPLPAEHVYHHGVPQAGELSK